MVIQSIFFVGGFLCIDGRNAGWLHGGMMRKRARMIVLA